MRIDHINKLGAEWAFKLSNLKYSELPYFLLLVWIAFYLIMGKNVEMLTFNFGEIPVRFSHVSLLVLSYLTFPLFRSFFSFGKSNGKSVLIWYFLFLLLGALTTITSFASHSSLRHILGSGGIFYYAMFFYIAFVVVNSSPKVKLFLQVLLYSWALGAAIFIFSFIKSSGGALPLGYRLSSDVLPMIAGVIIVLYLALSKNIEIKYFKSITLFAFGFLIMVLTKGVLLSALLMVMYFLYSNFRKNQRVSSLNILRVKISLVLIFLVLTVLVLLFPECILEIMPLSERGKINILIRLYMWWDIWNAITPHFFLGNGFVPFISETMHQIFVNPKMSHNVNPHNSYLNLAYFSGIFAPVIFFMFIYAVGKLVRSFLNRTNNLSFALFCGGGVMVLSAFSTPVLELFYLAPFLWVMLGIACRMTSKDFQSHWSDKNA